MHRFKPLVKVWKRSINLNSSLSNCLTLHFLTIAHLKSFNFTPKPWSIYEWCAKAESSCLFMLNFDLCPLFLSLNSCLVWPVYELCSSSMHWWSLQLWRYITFFDLQSTFLGSLCVYPLTETDSVSIIIEQDLQFFLIHFWETLTSSSIWQSSAFFTNLLPIVGPFLVANVMFFNIWI